jgi:hypothetical protein
MPHTPELLNRLREALAVADAAEDHLVAAYLAYPVELLEARHSKPPPVSGSPTKS